MAFRFQRAGALTFGRSLGFSRVLDAVPTPLKPSDADPPLRPTLVAVWPTHEGLFLMLESPKKGGEVVHLVVCLPPLRDRLDVDDEVEDALRLLGLRGSAALPPVASLPIFIVPNERPVVRCQSVPLSSNQGTVPALLMTDTAGTVLVWLQRGDRVGTSVPSARWVFAARFSVLGVAGAILPPDGALVVSDAWYDSHSKSLALAVAVHEAGEHAPSSGHLLLLPLELRATAEDAAAADAATMAGSPTYELVVDDVVSLASWSMSSRDSPACLLLPTSRGLWCTTAACAYGWESDGGRPSLIVCPWRADVRPPIASCVHPSTGELLALYADGMLVAMGAPTSAIVAVSAGGGADTRRVCRLQGFSALMGMAAAAAAVSTAVGEDAPAATTSVDSEAGAAEGPTSAAPTEPSSSSAPLPPPGGSSGWAMDVQLGMVGPVITLIVNGTQTQTAAAGAVQPPSSPSASTFLVYDVATGLLMQVSDLPLRGGGCGPRLVCPGLCEAPPGLLPVGVFSASLGLLRVTGPPVPAYARTLADRIQALPLVDKDAHTHAVAVTADGGDEEEKQGASLSGAASRSAARRWMTSALASFLCAMYSTPVSGSAEAGAAAAQGNSSRISAKRGDDVASSSLAAEGSRGDERTSEDGDHGSDGAHGTEHEGENGMSVPAAAAAASALSRKRAYTSAAGTTLVPFMPVVMPSTSVLAPNRHTVHAYVQQQQQRHTGAYHNRELSSAPAAAAPGGPQFSEWAVRHAVAWAIDAEAAGIDHSELSLPLDSAHNADSLEEAGDTLVQPATLAAAMAHALAAWQNATTLVPALSVAVSGRLPSGSAAGAGGLAHPFADTAVGELRAIRALVRTLRLAGVPRGAILRAIQGPGNQGLSGWGAAGRVIGSGGGGGAGAPPLGLLPAGEAAGAGPGSMLASEFRRLVHALQAARRGAASSSARQAANEGDTGAAAAGQERHSSGSGGGEADVAPALQQQQLAGGGADNSEEGNNNEEGAAPSMSSPDGLRIMLMRGMGSTSSGSSGSSSSSGSRGNAYTRSGSSSGNRGRRNSRGDPVGGDSSSGTLLREGAVYGLDDPLPNGIGGGGDEDDEEEGAAHANGRSVGDNQQQQQQQAGGGGSGGRGSPVATTATTVPGGNSGSSSAGLAPFPGVSASSFEDLTTQVLSVFSSSSSSGGGADTNTSSTGTASLEHIAPVLLALLRARCRVHRLLAGVGLGTTTSGVASDSQDPQAHLLLMLQQNAEFRESVLASGGGSSVRVKGTTRGAAAAAAASDSAATAFATSAVSRSVRALLLATKPLPSEYSARSEAERHATAASHDDSGANSSSLLSSPLRAYWLAQKLLASSALRSLGPIVPHAPSSSGGGGGVHSSLLLPETAITLSASDVSAAASPARSTTTQQLLPSAQPTLELLTRLLCATDQPGAVGPIVSAVESARPASSRFRVPRSILSHKHALEVAQQGDRGDAALNSASVVMKAQAAQMQQLMGSMGMDPAATDLPTRQLSARGGGGTAALSNDVPSREWGAATGPWVTERSHTLRALLCLPPPPIAAAAAASSPSTGAHYNPQHDASAAAAAAAGPIVPPVLLPHVQLLLQLGRPSDALQVLARAGAWEAALHMLDVAEAAAAPPTAGSSFGTESGSAAAPAAAGGSEEAAGGDDDGTGTPPPQQSRLQQQQQQQQQPLISAVIGRSDATTAAAAARVGCLGDALREGLLDITMVWRLVGAAEASVAAEEATAAVATPLGGHGGDQAHATSASLAHAAAAPLRGHIAGTRQPQQQQLVANVAVTAASGGQTTSKRYTSAVVTAMATAGAHRWSAASTRVAAFFHILLSSALSAGRGDVVRALMSRRIPPGTSLAAILASVRASLEVSLGAAGDIPVSALLPGLRVLALRHGRDSDALSRFWRKRMGERRGEEENVVLREWKSTGRGAAVQG